MNGVLHSKPLVHGLIILTSNSVNFRNWVPHFNLLTMVLTYCLLEERERKREKERERAQERTWPTWDNGE